MTVDLRFLYYPEDFPLRRLRGHFGQGEQGTKILDTLETVGVRTYGELLKYAERNDFSHLPGIGAHAAERIHRFIELIEHGNKVNLVHKFLEMSQTLAHMRDIADKLLQNRSSDLPGS